MKEIPRKIRATIAGLWVFPVKAMAGSSLKSAKLTKFGLEHDRSFVVTDRYGNFVSQRQQPRLALMHAALMDSHLVLTWQPSGATFAIHPEHPGIATTAMVWGDQVSVIDMGDEISSFLGRYLPGCDLRLCRMGSSSVRVVSQKYTGNQVVDYGFADGFPFLVTSVNTLQALNDQLSRNRYPQVDMLRFRPNIVVTGTPPFYENKMMMMKHSQFELCMAKPCTRCQVINVDPQTAQSSPLTMKGLTQLCRSQQLESVVFGQNAYVVDAAQGSRLCVGDQVEFDSGEV